MSELKKTNLGRMPVPCAVCKRETLLRIERGDKVVPLCSIVCHADWIQRYTLERMAAADRVEAAERALDEIARHTNGECDGVTPVDCISAISEVIDAYRRSKR